MEFLARAAIALRVAGRCEHRHITLASGRLCSLATVVLLFSGVVGSEFLPHLDEGAIWARGTLAPSTGPTEGTRVMNQARLILASFPEVKQVVSQVGRPDDGTDTTGFFNTEYFVDLEAKRSSGGPSSTKTKKLDFRDGQGTEQDSRRALEFLAAHFRQHGRSRQRRKRRTRRKDVWRRSELLERRAKKS